MTLCDRYVLREFLQAFLVGLLTSLLLVIALRFQQVATQLARESGVFSQLFTQILWDLPNVLEMALPVATALGAALATNRLTRDNELTVLRGTGKPLVRLFLPFGIAGLVLAAAGLYTANTLQPQAVKKNQEFAGMQPSTLGAVEAGQATRGGANGEWLVQFERGQKKGESLWGLSTVSLLQKQRVLLAPEATYEGSSGRWTLKNATEHRYDARGKLIAQVAHPSLVVDARTDFSGALPFWSLQQSFQTALSFADLTKAAEIARRKGDRRKALEYETGRWFKLALSGMCFVFALCAPPLCVRFSKAGSFAGVLLSVIIVFVGWNTVLLMKSVALSGWVPPVACAFSTHVLFILVALVLLARSD
ncbi:LptF/LptG family permease [Armatimonas sp.]|uniref:LptF/LptG family permease n=1 Tax=Armatimonas sp. TaxID=1872638 RepID=UPI00374D6FAE